MGIKESSRLFTRNWILRTPVESYPLLAAVLAGVSYGAYILGKKIMYDPTLQNPGEWDRWAKKIEGTEKGVEEVLNVERRK
ncbi:hypothetical protein BC829DRAFT_385975 [Chytridium lagenaria]|nr:hypothetical protein BC829DRAFT_385975 [Chytridium lagenaria]